MDELELITYKFIIIGDSTVGKTCFFKKLTTGKYSNKNISTIGIDRKTLSLKVKINENGEEKDKNFEIQIWDTAGQERFRAITKGYYKDSQGLILMYDITNQESFDNIEKWVLNVKDLLGEEENNNFGNNNKYLTILLGNKVDLSENGLRKVPTELAEKKCNELNIFWGGEISVKDFSVEELIEKFKDYTKEVYKLIGNDVAVRNTIRVVKSDQIENKTKTSKCRC